MLVSKEFKTVTEFRKQYEEVRTDILIRHGYQPGDKDKLKKAMALMIKFEGMDFINTGCYTITEMKDKVQMYQLYGSSEVAFRLEALV